MECGYARLTVWFADPFWVGVYEREAEGRLEVCRHTFGAEPKDGEVWQWLLSAWRGLDFSPAVEAPRGTVQRKPAPARRPSRPSSSSGRRAGRNGRSGIAKGTRRRRSAGSASARRKRRRSAGGTNPRRFRYPPPA